MQSYSWMIRDEMGDQKLGENLEKNSVDGMTITVQKRWMRDDEDEWPEDARWIKEQFERLRAILSDILSDTPSERQEDRASVIDQPGISDGNFD